MKFPRLPDYLNKSRKLLDWQILQMQHDYKALTDSKRYTDNQITNMLAKKYAISHATVWYWTHPDYQRKKRIKNAAYWDKVKLTDPARWQAHRDRESKFLHTDRRKRHPALKLYDNLQSAKNETRSGRHTFHGVPMEFWGEKDHQNPNPPKAHPPRAVCPKCKSYGSYTGFKDADNEWYKCNNDKCLIVGFLVDKKLNVVKTIKRRNTAAKYRQ